MNALLSAHEQHFIEKLMRQAFEHAGMALTNMLGKAVGIHEQIVPATDRYATSAAVAPYRVLVTEVRGAYTAESYLILDNIVTAQILSACLKTDAVPSEALAEAVLLEIDNILAASVITIFANKLNVNIYGFVPTSHTFDRQALENFLHEKELSEKNTMFVQVVFSIASSSHRPLFIWQFSQDFIEALKHMAQLEQHS